MLPGKTYTPEDLLLILRRRIWLVLVPFAVVSAATAIFVRRLPDRYRSEAVIMVTPSRVPEDVVQSQVVTRIEDRLPAINQLVMSRARLEKIILDLDLYKAERRAGIMEDVIEQMRSSIVLSPVRGEAFKVQFVGNDARTVMRVADRISSLVMDESTRDRQVFMEGTDQFLEAELQQARDRLVEHEKKLEAYKRQHAGELPTQASSNLQAVQNYQAQIQTIVTSIDRAQERRLLLERQLVDLESADPLQVAGGDLSPTAQLLSAARSQLAQLLLRFKADHPDAQAARRTIRDLEGKLEAESLRVPLSSEGSSTGSTAEESRQRGIADLRAQIEQLTRQTDRNQAEVQRLRQAADIYQRRAEAGPTRESEMTGLNRDYRTLQEMYTSLLTKREEVSIAANLERRQIGEQFKIVDQARIPARPFSPNRPVFNLIGMAAGLGIGLALVALLEYRSTSLQTDDELTSVLALPVLAVVPFMESDRDHRRRLRYRMLVGMGLGSAVAGCFAIVLYTFVR